MSAFLVNDDTLDLLASFIAQWSQDSHISGIDLYLKEGVLPPRTEGIEVETDQHGHRRVSIANTQGRAIKAELLAENIASLWGRYPAGRPNLDDASDLVNERAPFRSVSRDDADYAEVAGALYCYEYQSCETDDWENSFAYALCQGARRKLTSILGDGNWEYDRNARRQEALVRLGRA